MELKEFNKIIREHTYTKEVHPKVTNVILEEPHDIFINNIELLNDIKEIAIIKTEKDKIEIQLYDNDGDNKLNIDLDEIDTIRIYMNLIDESE